MSKFKSLLTLGAVFMVTAATAQEAPKPTEAPKLTTERSRNSYAVGVATARALLQKGAPDIDEESLIQGLKDALARHPLLLSEDEYRATYHAYQTELINKVGKARELAAWDNKTAGDAYLAANAKKEGVVTLPNGLEYKVLVAGTGEKPHDVDTVTCNYRGTLIDGVEFDSTYSRNQPATFSLKNAIPGWREALKLMPVGSKWQLFIPPELAYGKKGAGGQIGPNATLIFELELVSIDKS